MNATGPGSEAQPEPGDGKPASAFAVLGWAAYLACSWTWCIGMFLPVLLIRDFGLWGFVVFAVPNVVGAAAMGWVLKPGAAERIVSAHAAATRWFSIITAMFQFAFMGMAFSYFQPVLAAAPSWGPWVPTVGLLLVLVLASRRQGYVFVWAVSAAVGLTLLTGGRLQMPDVVPALARTDAAPLALVCLLGFGLCPYLDRTFLLARQALTSSASRVAFGLGFGVFFAAMLAMTLGYAAWFITRPGGAPDLRGQGTLALLLWVHIFIQLILTVLAHFAAHVGYQPRPRRSSGRPAISLSGLAGAMPVALLCMATFILSMALSVRSNQPMLGITLGEFVYRLFMSFYGLVFPAYVWVCLIPRRGGFIAPPTRASLVVCGVAVALASPCYWLGFIERQTWWLVPGVAIVILARWCVPAGRPVETPHPATSRS